MYEKQKEGAILASNTSTLDIDEIANATNRPEEVVGTHFFSPANVMRLLEIVRGSRTKVDILATLMSLAKKIKKVGIIAGNCDGFVGNIALKTTEGVVRMFGKFLTAEYKKNWFTKIIALISLSLLKAFKKRLDPRRYNGASFLGLNGIVVKSHGGADILAFKTAIITAIEESENRILDKIKKQIKIESN